MPGDGELRTALVDGLLRDGVLTEGAVTEAMRTVPRHLFLRHEPLERAYADDAVVTRRRLGRATSSASQPAIVGLMLDQLDVRPGDRVLEIGAGTGYNAALLAELGADVTSIELQEDVADEARASLRIAGYERVRVVTADAAHGAFTEAPYDRIIATAACWDVPDPWVGALRQGGTLVAPVRLLGGQASVVLQHRGEALEGGAGLPCGFMVLQGPAGGPGPWALPGGGTAHADVPLPAARRELLGALLTSPGTPDDAGLAGLRLRHVADAMTWLGVHGMLLLSLGPDAVAACEPGAALVAHLDAGRVDRVTRHGDPGIGARAAAALRAWDGAGRPGVGDLALRLAPAGARLPGTPEPLLRERRGTHVLDVWLAAA